MTSHRTRVLAVVSVALLVAALLLSACTSAQTADESEPADAGDVAVGSGGEDMATIYLAGGCFWGVEKLMASIPGVLSVESGYANGTTDAPTYKDVVTGSTGYAETVKVDYDPAVAPLPFLLEWYYRAIDPTSLNRQGNDAGTQYRTGIFYVDEADREVAERSLDELQEQYDEPVVVELQELSAYTPAEEYHQDYLDKNPAGYCHIGWDLIGEAAEAKPDAAHFE